MPDITMCTNKECPAAKGCFRFMAKPSQRQSMATFRYEVEPDFSCDHFVDKRNYPSYEMREMLNV